MPSRCSAKRTGKFDDVDADWLFVQAALFEFDANFFGDVFGAAHLRRHGAAKNGDAGVRTAVEPGAVQLMMLGGGAEIPQDRFVVLRKQREAVGFVLRPGADVRRGEVAHVVHVEAEQRAHLGLGEQRFRFGEALAAETIEVDSILPIDRHGSVSF